MFQALDLLNNIYFDKVTTIISGSTYPTANIILPYVIKIKMHLEQNVTNIKPFICQMVTPMLSKFNKYWADVEDVHCIASIMDPRYKMSLLTHIYKQKMHLSCTEAEDKLNTIKIRKVILNILLNFFFLISFLLICNYLFYIEL